MPIEPNTDDQITRVFFVRHGQTDHNVAKILQGHLDTDLNEEGIKQASLIGSRLAEFPIDAFYSSDLKRCRQTSKGIDSKLTTQKEIIFNEGLRERNMGEIEGKHIDEAIQYAEARGKHYRDFGEGNEKLVQRLDKVVNEILHESKGKKNVLVVTHGGTIRTILKILKHDRLTVVYNTSVTVVDFDKHDFNKFKIVEVGNTEHLGEGEFIVSDLRVR